MSLFGNTPPSWSSSSTDKNGPVNVSSPPFSMNGTSGTGAPTNSNTNMNGNPSFPSATGVTTRQSSNSSLNSNSGTSKPSISFPIQSLSSSTFSPGVPSNPPSSFGQQRDVIDSKFGRGGADIGGIVIGKSSGFMNNSNFSASSTPNNMTMNSFPTSVQSPSPRHTANFQPNPLLARPSPTSTSSPFAAQNQHSASDLASSVGLRRRTIGGGFGGPSSSKPPLPVMTRLGVSTDGPDSLKENLQIHANTDSTPLQNKTLTTPQNQIQTQLPTPQSIMTPSSSSSPSSSKFLATNYSCWVVISGFTNALEYNKILTNFASYGTIVDRYPSSTFSNDGASGSGGVQVRTGSNWVCIKYESSLQADKAICQNGSLVHVAGMNSLSSNSNSRSNSGSSPLSPSSNFTFQDDIVIIGVMRMNEGMAMKLGLKNYIEIGSTGYEKRIGGSRDVNSSGKGTSTPAINSNGNVTKQNINNPRFASSINNEDDILLLGDDGGRKKTVGNLHHGGQHPVGSRGGVCDKVLSWYFGW